MRGRVAFVFVGLLGGCAVLGFGERPTFGPPPAPRGAWIVDWEGRQIGQARVSESAGGVLIRLDFNERGLPPGWHGLAITETARCTNAGNGFSGAGDHLRQGSGNSHGFLHSTGGEAGDMPNLFAPSAGAFGAEYFSSRLTLQPTPFDGRASLLDASGSSLVIYAGPDDHASQPDGGAGARIACAQFTNE
jgi:superoxide dismutase, Cu-Zn family